MTSTSPSGAYRPTRPPLIARLREFVSLFTRLWDTRGGPGDPLAAHIDPRGAVLVIPALLRGDRQTRGLRAELLRNGYAAFGWELGPGLGPMRRLMAGAEARFLALTDAHGPINLIGLSMGGLFCRWLAFRHPDRVRQVITVCSPFRSALDSFWLPLRPLLKIRPIPGLAVLAAALERPLPVPGSYLYTRRDGIVAWESCIDVRYPEDCFEIDGVHVTIGSDPSVRTIILERLGRRLGGDT
jgi:pimeloyl-ACP methyl ester carboxylesterase